MKTYLRKKTINSREYFCDMTPFCYIEKKKIWYHSRYRGVQKENRIEKIRTNLPRNIFVYSQFIRVLRIMREIGIEGILDPLSSKDDISVLLVLAAGRPIRSFTMDLVYIWYDGIFVGKDYPCDVSSKHISSLLDDIGNSDIPDRFLSAFSSVVRYVSLPTISSYLEL